MYHEYRAVPHNRSSVPVRCIPLRPWRARGGGSDWAPRTRKRHQQEHRPQRPTERSDPTQHAKGRTGGCPGPRKGATTGRNVTQGVRRQQKVKRPPILGLFSKFHFFSEVFRQQRPNCCPGQCPSVRLTAQGQVTRGGSGFKARWSHFLPQLWCWTGQHGSSPPSCARPAPVDTRWRVTESSSRSTVNPSPHRQGPRPQPYLFRATSPVTRISLSRQPTKG